MFRVPDAASGPFLAMAAPGGPRQPPSASILRLSHGAW